MGTQFADESSAEDAPSITFIVADVAASENKKRAPRRKAREVVTATPIQEFSPRKLRQTPARVHDVPTPSTLPPQSLRKKLGTKSVKKVVPMPPPGPAMMMEIDPAELSILQSTPAPRPRRSARNNK